jgi:hypothetical protein
MATRLINKAIVSSLLQVAIGIEEVEFNKYIDEAQQFDFKAIVKEEFYFELLSKKDETAWKKLIDGGTYEYNGISIEFKGFADVLAYFTYARFFLSSPAVSTSHGIVQKTNPHSEPVPLEERRNVYYKKREEANTLMADVVKFIERNISDYPSWNGASCTPSKSSGFSTKVIQ